jgi:peptidyl-prolyl cis-trans isomerase C
VFGRPSLPWLACTLALVGVAAATPAIALVQVGPHALTIAQVQARVDTLPRYQWNAFGSDHPGRLEHFVEQALVPELLYGAEAEKHELEKSPALRLRVAEAYHRALIEALDAEVQRTQPVSDEDVARAEAEDPSPPEAGERILLWRILIDDDELAKKILVDAHGADGPSRWRAHARDHSLDAATKMRGGELGFVGVDGRTDVPQVRVEPALFAAAARVGDGELVPEPVPEGDHLAVVWRRGTRAAQRPADAERRAQWADLVHRRRVHDEVRTLLSSLRARFLTEHRPEHLHALPPDRPEDVKPSRMLRTQAAGSAVAPMGKLSPPERQADGTLR